MSGEKVWTKSRSVGDDVVVYVKRWYLPKWCPGSAKLYGNLSSIVNSIEIELNDECEKLEKLLRALDQAKAHLKTEVKDIKTYRYNRAGETAWELEDVKYLKTFKNYVPQPDKFYLDVINAKFLRKLGISSSPKKSKNPHNIPTLDELTGNKDVSLTVLGETSDSAKHSLSNEFGVNHTETFRDSSTERKGNNSGKGNKDNKWKNRRKNESEEDHQYRVSIGKDDWNEDNQ
jgi:hypothetical protein